VRSRIGVAEDGLLATSQHCAHPPPLARQDCVADEIDLRKVTDEPPNTESIGDLLMAETERAELPMADRTVLAAGQRRDPMIQVVSW
jgi:hypothetical protein